MKCTATSCYGHDYHSGSGAGVHITFRLSAPDNGFPLWFLFAKELGSCAPFVTSGGGTDSDRHSVTHLPSLVRACTPFGVGQCALGCKANPPFSGRAVTAPTYLCHLCVCGSGGVSHTVLRRRLSRVGGRGGPGQECVCVWGGGGELKGLDGRGRDDKRLSTFPSRPRLSLSSPRLSVHSMWLLVTVGNRHRARANIITSFASWRNY